MAGSPERAPAGKQYERGSEEFSRVLAFSDGMFAIAMTLLVVGIDVPSLVDSDSVSELGDALNASSDSITSFFISFAVIGRYWFAHHQMFSLLKSFDRGLIGLNLVYLALIAFLPFPTALLGDYFQNPLAIAIYAAAVAIVSGMEVVLLRHAHRNGLLYAEMPQPVYEWARTASLTPVLFFALSAPIAFVSTELAVASWLLTIPAGIYLNGKAPPDAEDYFR